MRNASSSRNTFVTKRNKCWHLVKHRLEPVWSPFITREHNFSSGPGLQSELPLLNWNEKLRLDKSKILTESPIDGRRQLPFDEMSLTTLIIASRRISKLIRFQRSNTINLEIVFIDSLLDISSDWFFRFEFQRFRSFFHRLTRIHISWNHWTKKNCR